MSVGVGAGVVDLTGDREPLPPLTVFSESFGSVLREDSWLMLLSVFSKFEAVLFTPVKDVDPGLVGKFGISVVVEVDIWVPLLNSAAAVVVDIVVLGMSVVFLAPVDDAKNFVVAAAAAEVCIVVTAAIDVLVLPEL